MYIKIVSRCTTWTYFLIKKYVYEWEKMYKNIRADMHSEIIPDWRI